MIKINARKSIVRLIPWKWCIRGIVTGEEKKKEESMILYGFIVLFCIELLRVHCAVAVTLTLS